MSIKKNTKMTSNPGPWYEYDGPSPEYVRDTMFEKFKDKCQGSITEDVLKQIILEIVPDTRNDFGSWRGFSTFGGSGHVYQEVEKGINDAIVVEGRRGFAVDPRAPTEAEIAAYEEEVRVHQDRKGSNSSMEGEINAYANCNDSRCTICKTNKR